MLIKPEYEQTITHTHAVPDECTMFEFEKDFYRQLEECYAGAEFFGDNDWHSTLVRTNADMEYLHYSVLQLAVISSHCCVSTFHFSRLRCGFSQG